MNNTSGNSGNSSSYDSIFDGLFSFGERERNGSNFSLIIIAIIFFLIIGKESCFNFINGCFGEVDEHHHHHEEECDNFGLNGNILWIIGILVVIWLLKGKCGEEKCGEGVCKGRIKDLLTNDDCC